MPAEPIDLFSVLVVKSKHGTPTETYDTLFRSIEDANKAARAIFTAWAMEKELMSTENSIPGEHQQVEQQLADAAGEGPDDVRWSESGSCRWGTEELGMGWWEAATSTADENITVKVMKHNLAPADAGADNSPDEFEVESTPEVEVRTPARRGRKRKVDESKENATATTAKKNDVVVATSEEPVKRRRGRPRKSEVKADSPAPDADGDAEGEDDEDVVKAEQAPETTRKTREKNRWAEEPRRSSARLKQIAQDPPPAPAPVETPKKKKPEPATAQSVPKRKADEPKVTTTPAPSTTAPPTNPPATVTPSQISTPVASASAKRGRKANSEKMMKMISTITPPGGKTRTKADGTPVTDRIRPGRDFPTFTWKVHQMIPGYESMAHRFPSALNNDVESRTFKWRINENVPAPSPVPTPMSRMALQSIGATTTKPKSSTEHLPLFCFPENPPNARLIVLGCHPHCQAMLQPALELKARQVLDHFPEAVTMKEPLRVWYNGGYFLEHIPAETVCAELRKLHAGKPNNMVFSIAKGGYVVSFDDLTEEEVRGGMAWIGQGPATKRVKMTLGFPMGFEHLQQAASAASGEGLAV